MDDDLLICPFNTSHLIHRSRMLNHAVKCGKSHKGSTRLCPFNPAHEVIESEYRSHLLTCSKNNQPANPMDNGFGKLFPAQSSTKGKAKKRINKKKKQNSIPPNDPEKPSAKGADESCVSVNDDVNEENSVIIMEKDPDKPTANNADENCLPVNDVLREENSDGIIDKLEEGDSTLPLELDPAEENWTVVTGKNKMKCSHECSDEASGGPSMNTAPSEENWDDLVGKVRYDPEKVSEMKPVLRAPQGKTKTERKKFRKDERLRYSLLANN